MKWTWKILLLGIGIATLGALFGGAGNENVEGFMGLGFLLAIVGLVGVAAGSGSKPRKREKSAQPAPIHNHVTISLDMRELQKLIRDEVRLGLETRQSDSLDSGQHPRKVSYVNSARQFLSRK